MKIVRPAAIPSIAFVACTPFNAAFACDELVDTIISRHLGPVIETADCPLPGLDKKDHKLVAVCYESTGPTSHIRIDAQLSCHASGESVASKLLGAKNTPSASEDVTVEAEARGADCQLLSVNVKPSGELGKVLAVMFDANGKARQALQQGLAELCKT